MKSTNNYTINITFAKAHTNPKYMQILGALIKHPKSSRESILKITHGKSACGAFNSGPFAMLHFYGYAGYVRQGRQCLWYATDKGYHFYTRSLSLVPANA